MENTKRRGPHYAFAIFIGTCLIQGLIGGVTINSAGIYYNAITTELNVGFAAIALYITILFLVAFILLPFGGRILNKVDVRICAGVAVVLAAVSYVLMSNWTAIYQFYLTGVLLGIANVFGMFLIPPVLINRWFEKRVGLFLGLVSAMTGFTAVIMNPVGGLLISTYGWRTAYLVFGIIIFVFGSIGALILRDSPKKKGLLKFGQTSEELDESGALVAPEEPGILSSKALKTLPFFMVCGFAFVLSIVSGGLNQYLSPLAQSNGFLPVAAAYVVSCSSFGNMIAKPTLGAISDKSILVAVSVGCVSAIVSLTIQLLISGGALPVELMYVAGATFGICLATGIPMSEMIARRVFGTKDYSRLLSYVMAMVSIGSGVGPTLFGLLRDATGTFTYVLIAGIIFIVIAWICAFTSLRSGRKIVAQWKGDSKV